MSTASPRTARTPIILCAVATILGVVLTAAVQASERDPMIPGDAGAARSPSGPVLVLAVDGLSWNAFEAARTRGLFSRLRFAGRHVAPYPSMSHPSWTEIVGTRRVFGQRGNVRTVEARWFDLDEMRIADDPRQVIARPASPWNYHRAFDYYFDPIVEPLMYLPGRTLIDRELADAERAILDGFTGDRYVAFLGGADATAHTHLGELGAYLERLDAMVERVADSLDARGTPAEIWVVSDHGNAGGFAEGTPERFLQPVTLDRAVRRAGLTVADTGRLESGDHVAIVTIALATMVNVYFADLSRRRTFARSALADSAVELVTWLEVEGDDRYIVILGSNGTEARLRWRKGAYAYDRVAGDPLGLPDSLVSDANGRRWVADASMRAATIWGRYPDAPFRLVESAMKHVENAPDLIVNLRDGYCYAGDLGRMVRMVRTHGSITGGASLGVVASSARPVPSHVRGNEVLPLIGIAPESLLSRVRDLQPHDPLALARRLSAAPRRVATGRDDESIDAGFLRRARPLVVSMDYFRWEALRHLAAAFSPDSSAERRRSSQVTASRQALRRADLVAGVSGNLDALLPLTEPMGAGGVAERGREVEARLRSIPELSSLTDLRTIWDAERTTAGAAEPLRRGTMALWTFPYFLDDALAAPEHDSISDPRDAAFAVRWHAGLRSELADHPMRLASDTAIAPRLFREVYAERRLWRSVQPSTIPLLYDPDLGDITLAYVPGIYGELFDQEIWSRGLRAVRDRLGIRTLTVPVDGRCASSLNAARVVDALRDDTRRRVERGYATPRYLLVGYSKGGIDATEALLLAPDLARAQVAALVTVATPHRGTPVAERADLPAQLLQLTVSAPAPAACDTAGATRSLWPLTRGEFWSTRTPELAPLTRYFSVSFVSDAEHAHPWMKLTKRIAQFTEANDGVVGLSSSRFPPAVGAVDLGVVEADHIAARLASSFPQDAFLEALVITLAELGALDRTRSLEWRKMIATRERSIAPRAAPVVRAGTSRSASLVSHRAALPLPGGSSGWSAGRTFRMTALGELGDSPVRPMSRLQFPEGVVLRCDHESLLAFRREYEFYVDAGNGGSDGDLTNGFAMVPSPGRRERRACHMATSASSIKMTTVSFRFRPVDFPSVQFPVQVLRNVTGADVSRARRGKNDSAFKLWFILRDTRPEAKGRTLLLGYSWGAENAHGIAPQPGSLVEAASSRRNVVIATLPEAWLITIGGPHAMHRWQAIDRDLVSDLHRAFPGIPGHALEVVGITLQSDSDATSGTTEVLLESLRIAPRVSAPMVQRAADP